MHTYLEVRTLDLTKQAENSLTDVLTDSRELINSGGADPSGPILISEIGSQHVGVLGPIVSP